MASLHDLPVSRKFTYAFGIVCALCILLGISMLITFRGIATKGADVSQHSFPALVQLA